LEEGNKVRKDKKGIQKKRGKKKTKGKRPTTQDTELKSPKLIESNPGKSVGKGMGQKGRKKMGQQIGRR